MKKKQPMFDKSDKIFLACVGLVIFLCCVPFLCVYGASTNFPYSVTTNPRLDSLRLYIYDDGVINDSALALYTTGDTTLTLDDASDWSIVALSYWDGDGYAYPDPTLFVKYTAGVATVDYDSIAVLIAANAGSGSGSDTVVFYALDTSGTDTLINDVKLTVKDSTGTNVATGITSGNGNVTFYLDPNGYTVIGRATGWLWNSTPVTVSGNNDSVAITGYNISLNTPSSASMAIVYGYVKDISDNPIYNALITITRNTSTQVVDTTDGGGYTIVSPEPIEVYSDTAGFWQAEVRRTTAYSDTTRGFYDILGTYDHKTLFKVTKIYVPGSGNVNVGDTLNQRIQ